LAKSVVLGCMAGMGCVVIGTVLAHEPNHPQQVALLALMLGCYLSVLSGSRLDRLWLFLLGGVCAGLIFTKINLGGFFLVALGYTVACLLKPGWFRWVGIGIGMIFAVGAPYFLMRHEIPSGVGLFCLLATLGCTTAFALGSQVQAEKREAIARFLPILAGLLVASLLILGGTVWQGIPFLSLVQGVILEPLRLHSVFYLPFGERSSVVWVGIGVMVSVVLLEFSRKFEPRPGIGIFIDAFRCVVGLGTVVVLMLGLTPIDRFLPLLPLALIRGVRTEWTTTQLFPRLFITYLAATEYLGVFPVAGSQIGIAASPFLVWAFVCVVDGGAGLKEAWKQASLPANRWLLVERVVFGLLLAVAAGKAFVTAQWWSELHPHSLLPHSAILHMDPMQEKKYELLAGTIQANCKVLYGMPELGSLNFWSGLPTPNWSNEGAWMKGMSAERQAEILRLIQGNPDVCVVYRPELVSFWHVTAEEEDALPLGHYIVHEMPKAAWLAGYEIRVHPQRTAPWVTLGR